MYRKWAHPPNMSLLTLTPQIRPQNAHNSHWIQSLQPNYRTDCLKHVSSASCCSHMPSHHAFIRPVRPVRSVTSMHYSIIRFVIVRRLWSRAQSFNKKILSIVVNEHRCRRIEFESCGQSSIISCDSVHNAGKMGGKRGQGRPDIRLSTAMHHAGRRAFAARAKLLLDICLWIY